MSAHPRRRRRGRIALPALLAFAVFAPAASGAVSDPAPPTTAPPESADRQQTATPSAAFDGQWTLPDKLTERLDEQWQKNRELYLDRGSVSIRSNAMLLELHSLAALAGHQGASRRDDRIPGLVRLFTTPPVVVTRTKTKRSTASFPHAPAWESVYRADSEQAVLHPSADAIVARALATAWRARDVAGLPAEDAARIQQVVGAVAKGSWYKAPSRAENQINWNTDVYAANLEVNGDRSNLPDYRAHLKWFIDHAFKDAYQGGSSNLSRGYGFRYLPQYEGGGANKVDTVEYANLVHSALGFYTTAVRAGMRPLSSRQISQLRAWSRHILFGTWTHSGYLNWDSGLGTSRRHLRQYWAFALDSLVRSAGPGALLGTAEERAYVKYIATQGLLLFSRTAWDGTGPLPSATSFDAPNGFPTGTGSPLITPLRFAVIAASLDVTLPATTPAAMGNSYAHDSEFGRLVVTTPAYNAAVVKPVSQGEGGLEPTRLFDAKQRPLTVLAAGGFGGPSPGLRLQRYGTTVLEDQPGTRKGAEVPAMSVSGNLRNRAGGFGSSITARGTMRSGKASITVQHRFTTAAIETSYEVNRGTATSVAMRFPVWGRDSTIDILRGARVVDGTIRRTNGTILIRGTTPSGGVMLVAFRGVPTRATISVVRHNRSARAPQGAKEIRFGFQAAKGMSLERRVAVVVDAPQR